jgi:uncharacterized protein YigA (DUF484 family)
MASKKEIQAAQQLANYQKEREKALNKEKLLIKDQTNLSKELLKTVSANASENDKVFQLQLNMAKKLEERVSTSDAIKLIDESITTILEEQAKLGEDIDADLLKKLELNRAVFQQMDEIAKATDYVSQLEKDREKTLGNILGLDDDIAKAVGAGAIAALAMNKAFENVGASLTKHVDTMKDMVTQQGLSVREALTLKGSVDAASFSMTGLIYGSDALASSAEAIATKFGNVNAATGEMIKSVTEVATLTGDAASATDLVTTFQNAGMEAEDVSGHIKELAEKHGVNAKKMMEGMAGQMSILRGKTQEQLDVILEGNAALIKQGTNMEEIQAIAEGVLDIEGNMKAAAKARVMLGRDLNNNAVRQAALDVQSASSDEERIVAQKRLAEEILKGVGGQRAFADMSMKEKDIAAQSYGMTTEQLSVMMEKKRVQDELTAKYGDSADTIQAIQGGLASAATGAGSLALEFGKVYLKALAFKMVSGEGFGGATKMFGGLTKALGLNKIATVASTVATGVLNGAIAAKNMVVGAATTLMNSNFVVKTKDFILDKARAAQALVLTGIEKTQSLLQKTRIGSYLAETAQKIASNVATFIGIGAATGQTAANVGLATSQTTLATTGAAAGGGMAAAGAGLGAFGAAAAPAIPIILAIGAALLMASPAIYAFSFIVEAFGKIIIGVLAAVPPIIEAIANGFVTMMGAITPENIGGLMLLGPALMLASVGMIAFSAAMLVGGIASFFGGGIMDSISELSMMGPQLEQAGTGMASITTNLGEVNGVVSTLAESLSTMGSVVSPLYAVAGGLLSISAGLTTMAISGLMAIPVIGALGMLAAVAPALEGLGSFFGGGDDSESSSSGGDSDMIDYDRLASVLQSQPIVLTIDGKAVQKITAVQRRQSKNARGFS